MNPTSDFEFEQLARVLADRPRKQKAPRPAADPFRTIGDEDYESLEMDPTLLRPVEEEDDENDEFLFSYLREGQGFAQDFDLGFAADFKDKGDGEVSILNHRGDSGTFTRATIATTVDRNGLVKQVASGVPRSYYDPTTGEYLGYLAEGARTNLCLRSEEFDNASWTKTRATVTANAAVAPDGTLTADKIVEDSTAASSHIVYQTFSFTDAAVYTYSVFAKAGERTWIALEELASGAGASTFTYVNLATGVAGTTAAAHTVHITAFPNGWYRVSITFTASGTSARNAGWRIVTADNVATHDGDGASGVYLWGAQFEQAAFASTYIPTTTASVTRNADVLEYPLSNFPNTEGTAYGEIFILNNAATSQIIIARNGAAALLVPAGAASVRIQDGTTALSSTCAVTSGVAFAAAWGSTKMSVVGEGGTLSTGSFDGSMGVSSFGIGNLVSPTTFPLWGAIRNVRIWKRQMPDANLQAITA